MPVHRPPASDENRVSFLETSAKTAAAERAAGRKTISQTTYDAIVAFLVIFRPLYDALARTLANRVTQVREREDARTRLDMFVRDFWEVLKRRAHRLAHPAGTLVLYGLSADGTVPVITTFADLVTAAETIATGETQAVANGLPPMANPSAAEVATELAAARTQAADVPTADLAYDTAQGAIAARRPEADLLAEDVMADLKSDFRRLDGPGLRRVQRAYGATFISLPGEPPEGGGGTTPPPVPPVVATGGTTVGEVGPS